ncbi:RDD family protein [Sphaerisporangium corydalis]|uniref:RDD family protein n=1 Tax=Sphaerisporangium corydalis TaxID=1441875 RepID=A0ABV9EBT8_9ACTN|nr:RDD family protein [Sphaerisporangium corydalis]
MAEVVTGEAVVVEVRVAQLPSRALALFIDMTLQFLLLVGLSVMLTRLLVVTDEAFAVALSILITALVVVGYPVIFETLGRGRSLGKLAMGLRVVSDDGGPERFRQALFRGLSGVLEFWTFFGAPALISSLISAQGKRLGDVFSGTIVISERGPRQAPPPEMPPALAGWATTLELSRLPEDLAATARQYLSRWHQLAPMVQYDMGTRIAAQFASFVSPPPPPAAPPYAYLAAVLAERRRRTQIRLASRARPAFPPNGRPHPGYPAPNGPSHPGYPANGHARPAFPAPGGHAGPGYPPPGGPAFRGFAPPPPPRGQIPAAFPPPPMPAGSPPPSGETQGRPAGFLPPA